MPPSGETHRIEQGLKACRTATSRPTAGASGAASARRKSHRRGFVLGDALRGHAANRPWRCTRGRRGATGTPRGVGRNATARRGGSPSSEAVGRVDDTFGLPPGENRGATPTHRVGGVTRRPPRMRNRLRRVWHSSGARRLRPARTPSRDGTGSAMTRADGRRTARAGRRRGEASRQLFAAVARRWSARRRRDDAKGTAPKTEATPRTAAGAGGGFTERSVRATATRDGWLRAGSPRSQAVERSTLVG